MSTPGSSGRCRQEVGRNRSWHSLRGVQPRIGAGVLGVLYSLLISNPRRQVREAVDHLMQVKIIFLAYLRRLHQTDQAYTRLLLSGDKVTAEQLKEYTDIVGAIMERTAKQMAEAVPTNARSNQK